MDPDSRAAALDDLAGSLRERLVARAGEEDGLDAQAGIRALVEREAALLDPADREELVARVAEPSGACALAALLAGRVDARALRVGVIITGGNVSADRFAALIAQSRP